MWNVRWPAVALAALVLSGFGCGEDGGDDAGDDAAQGGSAGSAAGTAGSQGLPAGNHIVASKTAPRAGECQSSANCTGTAAGTPACATIAGDYRVCTYQPPVVTAASTSAQDQCDGTRACAAGTGSCYSVSSYPTGQCGAGFQTRNMCRKDTCASDADCPEGVCGPRGFASENLVSGGAIRQCIKADCKSSAECTAKPGGICALVQPGCVTTNAQGAQSFYPAQLACVYPDGCTNISNCPNTAGSTCKVVNGVGVCLSR